ncbi:acetate--CoA ligase family protein [Patescibacteria group bacterium]|nr:acetate--CoA ligase family protein [Patescibacteria group bacterium]MBU4162151.1 acetate--CoA ligase family protein [Patescibacteria group bacterium]
MLLGLEETKKLLAKYKIPQVKAKIVKTVKEAILFSKQNEFPVVLKIFSPKIIHKTDIWGVIIDIKNEKDLLTSWVKIEKIAKAKKTEIIIQKMIFGEQIIIGAKRDSVFGPVVAFGLGGIFVEILKDISFRLAPINKKEAKEMISEIQGNKILKGYRNRELVNLLKLEEILLSLSLMISREQRIKEIDLNPVIANKKGAMVIDAKIIL